MEVLKGQCDLSCIKDSYIVGEQVFFSEQPEYLSSLHEVKNEVKVLFVLERFLQVDNKRILDASQKLLLVFNVINLVQFDDLTLFQHLDSKRFSIKQSEVNLAESASTDDLLQGVVTDLAFGVLYLATRV